MRKGTSQKMNKYEGKFVCGYCKKETLLTDEQVESVLLEDNMIGTRPLCDCGYISYASTLKTKMKCNVKDWRFVQGSIE